ncbi:unnamed protein product [Allacma fusca]|uniref:Uncharacterized protein n=1 Tax=Allacma fusca TaxID=39272 RepID=A0A8J2JBH8_9HEXA|nr:unnamed protein product [Allacma fusca]
MPYTETNLLDKMPIYSWKPKEPPVIPPPFVPDTQPPLPQNLRFTRADVVFHQAIDWWSPNAPAAYVDPRENCRTKVKREVGEHNEESDESTSGDTLLDTFQHEVGVLEGPEDDHVEEGTCSSQEGEREAGDNGSEMTLKDRKRLEQIEFRKTKLGRTIQKNRRKHQRYNKNMRNISGLTKPEQRK